ncbi:MAG: EF-hand domain-containing protein, partial [Candidatus Hydrogenedentes bacterium]|nr:EF-hand domain-containing protein [Candidatus Hydrogenedentota bacterium]
CDDLGVFPIDEDWGALPFPAEEMLSLRLLNLLRRLFPILDVNGDNILSYEEIRSRIPLPERLFILLDTDGDGLVSWDEIEEWIDYFTGTSQEIIIDFSREIIGSGVGNFFIPGDPLLIRIAVNKYGMDTLTRFRITEMLPKGWTVGAVYNKGTATVVTAAIAGVNKVTISWEGVPPMFPLDLVYELIPPADATGIVTVLGQAVYSSDTGMHSSGMIPTVLIELLAQDYAHSADSNADWRISLSELLRVIQLYGSGTYHLNPFSEDGYDIGDGATDGPAHSADYLNDWRITLSELIRVVQLYNASSRFYCVAGDTEDGYMPAPF